MTTKEDIQKVLWNAAGSFRGKIDSGKYKDYILSMLFVKYLSDAIKETKEELTKRYNGDAERIQRALQRGRFFVPDEATFDYLYANKKATDIGSKINIALKAIENANGGKLRNIFGQIDFNSQELGDGREKVALLSNFLEDFSSIDLRPSQLEGVDEIGNAYMYMLAVFASDAGKKGGEFYTPEQVSEILARVVEPQENDRIYDGACGSGSLLIKAFNQVPNKKAQIYGQERNFQTWGLCRMNMFIHDIDDAIIYQGDTIANPQNIEDGKLMQFQCIVANPPFSLDKWANGYAADSNDKDFKMSKELDPYKRFDWGVPPKSKGDYAFILHMLHCLDGNNGRMAIIMPHGVLFRGASEGEIRKKLIDLNLLDAVIGLPANLFYGTSIPACILVFKKNRANKDILFIDASKDFEQGKNQNKLRPEDIEKIVATFKARKEVEKYCHIATIDEIRENDYNLNIPRYVDTFEEEEQIDIHAVMAEIKELEAQRAELDKEIEGYLKELGL